MERATSIYPNVNLENALRLLNNDTQVSQQNKDVITKFGYTWLAKGVTQVRLVKLVCWLRKLSAWLKTPFDEATKDDLMRVVGELEQSNYSDNTKYDVKIILKVFYKWLKGEDEQMPKVVSWLKPRLKVKHKLPEEILTEEEVLKIAKAAQNSKDKALVLMLYESGCRIGELLTLKVKNVQFDQYGAVLKVVGKTGHRRVRIISSAPTLRAWLENHPNSDNPEASLWPARNSKQIQTPILHRTIYKTLQDLATRAGVKKKIYPHLFRHSRATKLASKLTEAQMKEYFGWQQASEMASVYVHLSGRDVDNALLELQGLKTTKDKPEEQIQVKICTNCQEKNSPIAKFCNNCGTATSNPNPNDNH